MFPFSLPDRYQFLGEKLKGGQGDIYVFLDKFLDRKVAIKVMVDNADLRKELVAIQGVRSRHIAQLYDIVETKNGAIGLVEEFVPGDHVSEYAAKNDISGEFEAILYQIACGLSDIHASGKVHRDIKPANMKFDGEHIIKILDFGLAAEATPDLETVDARGTPCYIAPELYASPPIKFTGAVDTFAFGVTARVIAQGGAILPVFRQTPPYQTPFPSFSTCPITIAPDVVAILDLTLQLDPNRRPRMSEVRDALAKRLVFGKHKALITYGKNHLLQDVGKSGTLKVGNDGITISYNGLSFNIISLTGNVYINNAPASVGMSLPDSCVITLGPPYIRTARTYVPFNVSHPEVVL